MELRAPPVCSPPLLDQVSTADKTPLSAAQVKFLVDKEGVAVKRYSKDVPPSAIEADIQAALATAAVGGDIRAALRTPHKPGR